MGISTKTVLLCLAAGTLLVGGEFRAAAVKAGITPQTSQWLLGYAARRSTGVHDHLFHRVVVMDDGRTQFVLISTDIALTSPAFYDEFCAELQRETGLGPVQVWWSATHTHSAPEVGPPGLPRVFMGNRYEHEWDRDYASMIRQTLMNAIREARGKLVPARLGVGTGISFANINRRARDVDGKISLGMNPDGPVDRQIGLVRIDRMDGSPLALIANYAIHGTVLGGQNLLISGDAPGVVAAYVEEKVGAPVLFVNGAAGDIAPIYSVYPDFKSGHLSQFRVLLGDRILAANEALRHTAEQVDRSLGEKVVETPRKEGLGWTEELASYLRTDATGTALVRVPVRFLKINRDTLLWAAPLELFCEIAIRVRNHSPFANTFYFGYTNGWLGYMPTKAAFAEGGYEPGVSPFSDRVEEDFSQAVIRHIQGLSR